nr:hypothetical protein [Marinicella sp. W31]MDC2877933.1 hypothetical protein [Marinicella sp. W31]
MSSGDLFDLIDITLQLSMRLGYAETASHLYRAYDALQPCPKNSTGP